MFRQALLVAVVATAAIAQTHKSSPPANASSLPNEGMWPLDQPPRRILAEHYDFEPSQEWLDHLRRTSVRLSNGGSGAIVGRDGLIVTSHHLVLSYLQRASSLDRNLVVDGHLARERSQEIRCPGLSMSLLLSTADVTKQVGDAKDPAAAIRQLELNPRTEERHVHRQVERLYRGAVWSLHRYRHYDDLRLVFAPHLAVGFFGGHEDNFNYPRYCLDVAFLRAYENGRPVRFESVLRANPNAPRRGDLVFVVGNPAPTQRRQTVAQVLASRDVIFPTVIAGLRAQRDAMLAIPAPKPAAAATLTRELWLVQNSLKYFEQQQQVLLDVNVIERKRRQEQRFLENTDLRSVETAFRTIESQSQRFAASYRLVWLGRLPGRLAATVHHAIRAAKDGGTAAPRQARRTLLGGFEASIELPLLRAALTQIEVQLGAEHPFARTVLGGRDAAGLADEIIARTRLSQPDVNQRLASCRSAQELKGLNDPMVDLMLVIDAAVAPHRAELREAERLLEIESDRIAQICVRRFGRRAASDPNRTLRMSFGLATGYSLLGHRVPFQTTIGGLFDRHDAFDGKEPFHLPAAIIGARSRLNLTAPLNFVCSADISTGSSGSAVLDRSGNWVGVIFDGNAQSLGNAFLFDDRQARAIAVHTGGVLEFLRHGYGANELLAELSADSEPRDAK